jgi:O-antigen ligase
LAALFFLFAVAALVELGQAERIDALLPFRRWRAAWALVIWALLSVAWSINPEGALIEAAKLAAEVWAGFFVLRFAAMLPEARRTRLLQAAAGGLALGAALALTDAFAGGRLTMWGRGKATFSRELYSRGAAVAGVLIVPLSIALLRLGRWRIVAPFALLAIAAVVILVAASAKLALAGGIVGAAAGLASRRGLRLLAVAAILFGTAMPVLARVELSPQWHCWLVGAKTSAAHRLAIWRFASSRVVEHPIIGWGLDASRVMPGGKAMVHLESCPNPKGGAPAVDTTGNILPLHPHDAPLQIWLELGLVGVTLTVVLALWSVLRAEGVARNGADRAIVAATALSLFAVQFVSFGVWQAWWICACLMAAAFTRMGLAAGTDQPALTTSEVQLGHRVAP